MALDKTTSEARSQLPKFAALTLLFLGLGAGIYLHTANGGAIFSRDAEVMPDDQNLVRPEITSPTSVLSSKDVELYRAIFAAQERGDWTTANEMMSKVSNKGLMGHVLADRYQHRQASPEELRAWLERYADLPEAIDFYRQAASQDDAKDQIPVPQVTTGRRWSGSDSYGTTLGFRSLAADRRASSSARRLISKLNVALRQNKPSTAENLLDTERRHHSISAHDMAEAEGLIAARFFYSGHIVQARRLADAALNQQNPLALWVGGLAAWKQNENAASANFFVKLAAQPDLSSWDRTAAEFWAWRALKRAGDSANAKYWLDRAAEHPHSFYGLMAAHLLDQDKVWSWDVPVLDNEQTAALAKEKAGWRALALLQIGRRDLAESELRHLNPQGRRDLQDVMLALATSEHMPSLSLQLGGVATKANGEPYDAALYPLPPWEPAEGFKVDPALLFALMRHESQFDPKAISTRGACGLMQLLPATANLMTDSDGTKSSGRGCSSHLLRPDVNVTLGQRYVKHLTAQPIIGDNLLLLLAAYNSGPNKIARWMEGGKVVHVASRKGPTHRDYEKSDPLLFLESLPVRETHDYVEQVLMHYWIYRARLDEPENSIIDLAHGKWPRIAPPERSQPLPKGTKEANLLDGILTAAVVKVASSQNPN